MNQLATSGGSGVECDYNEFRPALGGEGLGGGEIQNDIQQPNQTEGEDRSRNVLGEVWFVASLGAMILYMIDLTLLGYWEGLQYSAFQTSNVELFKQKPLDLSAQDDDERHRNLMQMVFFAAAAGFSATGLHALTSLAFCASKQRPVLCCTIVVTAITAHAHWLLFTNELPAITTCFGRPVSVVRFAMWHTTVPFVMAIVSALDCHSYRELRHPVFCQFFALSCGFATNFVCLFADQLFPKEGGEGEGGGGASCGSDSVLPALLPYSEHRGELHGRAWYSSEALAASSNAFRLSLFLQVLALVFFVDIYSVVLQRATSKKKTSLEATMLTLWVSITWTAAPVIFYIGTFNVSWLPPNAEESALTVLDILHFMVFLNVLSEVHLRSLSPGEAIKRELELKQHAHEAQKTFLRYVFHEVRVPLNTIRLSLDSIMEERLPEDCDMLVSSMNNAVGTMSETLNDVLSYQKIEEGKLELVPATFSPKDELKKVLSVFDISAKSDQLDLRIRIEDDVPRHLVSDCHRIRQILSNFLSNAIKFTPKHGTVVIATRMINQPKEGLQVAPYLSDFARNDNSSSEVVMVEFSVSDNGVGILPVDQKRLFQAFSQVRPGDLQAGRGSGLGLCICKRTAEMMGGSIGVRSSLGIGSTFFIALPLLVPSSSPNNTLDQFALEHHHRHQQQLLLPPPVVTQIEPQCRKPASKKSGTPKRAAEKPLTRSSSSSASIAAAAVLETKPATSTTGLSAKHALETSHLVSKSGGEGGLRVLVVDDVEMNRKLVARSLRKLPGFVVEEAKDGVEAVELVAERRYDAILMDNVMPRMSGLEAVAAIRKSKLACKRTTDCSKRTSKRQKTNEKTEVETHEDRLVIFGVTGNALTEDVEEFKRAGCDEVLTKPLQMSALKGLLSSYGLK